jgi:2'-5' RNA ligase
MELPETLRTFVALDLPDTMKQKLVQVQQELHSRCPEGVMYWPPVQSFHLTLFYLGNTPSSLRPSIEDALTLVGQRHSPISLLIAGLGNFPDASLPRVFWVGAQDSNGQLQTLYDAIKDCLGQFGYKTDYPTYHPHITLCKAEAETAPDMLRPFSPIAKETQVPSLGTIRIEEMTYFHSVPNLDTSVYIPLKKIPLGSRP